MSIDDGSATARACKNFYEPIRDALLRAHPWNFARRRASLSRLATTPAFGYAYEYQLPTDCLRVLEFNEEDVVGVDRPDAYEIEGRKLLTDAGQANIVYIARISDTNQFDSLFVTALSLQMAAELAMPITQSAEKQQALVREFNSLNFQTAARTDSNEVRSKRRLPWQHSDSVRSRGGAAFSNPALPSAASVASGGGAQGSIYFEIYNSQNIVAKRKTDGSVVGYIPVLGSST